MGTSYILKEPIIKLIYDYDGKILVIGETGLRVIDTESDEVKGGGSLKSRLEESIIIDSFFSTDSRILVVCTQEGSLLLYKLNGFEVKFLYQDNVDMEIEKVEYINGNLFLMNRDKISIFRVKFYEDSIKFFNVILFTALIR